MADGLARHLVDLGRRKSHRDHFMNGRHHPKNADAVGDKIWPVFRRDDALAQPLIEETGYFARDLAACFAAGDDLDELHIARRVKEMDADKMLLEIFRKRLGDRV